MEDSPREESATCPLHPFLALAGLLSAGLVAPAHATCSIVCVSGGWAASGEIDIMEAANATDVVGGTIHFGGTYPGNTSSGGSYSRGGASLAGAFHIYAIEWEPDAIRWCVDDVLHCSRTSVQWYSSGAPGNPRAPCGQAFYILLNAASGGGGLPAGTITIDWSGSWWPGKRSPLVDTKWPGMAGMKRAAGPRRCPVGECRAVKVTLACA